MPIYETTQSIIKEEEVKVILQKYFNVNLYKLSQFHEFDFKDNYGIYYEVKSRNNNHDKYPTTMIGYNKVQFANKLDEPVYFIFNFLDGVYYYEYEPSKLNELEIKIGGRCDRGIEEYKKYCYIGIDKLIKIDLNNQPPSQNRSVLKVYLDKKKIVSIKENELIL